MAFGKHNVDAARQYFAEARAQHYELRNMNPQSNAQIIRYANKVRNLEQKGVTPTPDLLRGHVTTPEHPGRAVKPLAPEHEKYVKESRRAKSPPSAIRKMRDAGGVEKQKKVESTTHYRDHHAHFKNADIVQFEGMMMNRLGRVMDDVARLTPNGQLRLALWERGKEGIEGWHASIWRHGANAAEKAQSLQRFLQSGGSVYEWIVAELKAIYGDDYEVPGPGKIQWALEVEIPREQAA
jgi:hypothetical protein